MAKRGMGAIYNRTAMGDVLRAQPDAVHRQTILDHWYWPHYVELERLVNDVVARSGICLIVDSHSFASVALPYQLDQTSERADICVGTDPFHRPYRSAMQLHGQRRRKGIRSPLMHHFPARWCRFRHTKGPACLVRGQQASLHG
jgi:hypothetical protein